MNRENLKRLIDESIQLELTMATLYELFHTAHPEDGEFWGQLYVEERSHANLLRTAKDSVIHKKEFPKTMVSESIKDVIQANKRIKHQLTLCKTNVPSRIEAFKIAIALENEVGESHFEQFMNHKAQNAVESVFQQINREDKNHEQRLRTYLKSLNESSN